MPHTDRRSVADSTGEALPRLDLPLMDLILTPGTALANAVRRVVEEAGSADGNYAAHGSSPHPGTE